MICCHSKSLYPLRSKGFRGFQGVHVHVHVIVNVLVTVIVNVNILPNCKVSIYTNVSINPNSIGKPNISEYRL